MQGNYKCGWRNSFYLQLGIKSLPLWLGNDSFSKTCGCSQSPQSCPTLCNPMDCSPPGSSVPGIPQARILEWVAMPSSRGSSPPRDRTCVYSISCIAGEFFTTEPLRKPHWRTKDKCWCCLLHGTVRELLNYNLILFLSYKGGGKTTVFPKKDWQITHLTQ